MARPTAEPAARVPAAAAAGIESVPTAGRPIMMENDDMALDQAYAQRGVHAYRRASLAGVSKEHVVTLLFDGAIDAVAAARRAIAARQIAQRGEAIGKAIRIVQNGLLLSLDPEEGGELANNVHDLYVLTIRDLLRANLHADDALLAKVHQQLVDVRDAWVQAVDVPHSAFATSR